MRASKSFLWAVLAIGNVGLAETFYVSPTGSDTNSGLSSATPWKSLGKVSSTSFQPGDQILLERGGEWREQLRLTSAGTEAAPIVVDTYGSGAKPKLWGSDPLATSDFQRINNNLYIKQYNTPVNALLANHSFMTSATMSTKSSSQATNIDYVANHANSWYQTADGRLFVNANGANPAADGRAYTAAVRDDVVSLFDASNVVIRNLVVDESAKDNAGYAFRVMQSDNVRIENSEAYRAGKHHFGVINSTEFHGKDLYTAYTMPQQDNASSYVSYSDARRSGDTSLWENITAEHTGGYDSFYTHTDGNGIGHVTIKNITARNAGIGVALPPGSFSIVGGELNSSSLALFTDGAVIDGLKVTGESSYISLYGNDTIVQNVVAPAFRSYVRYNAVIDDHGRNNVVRFSTFDTRDSFGVSSVESFSNTLLYGNIFSGSGAHIVRWVPTDNGLRGFNNLFSGQGHISYLRPTPFTWFSFTPEAWASMGFEFNSIVADPMFVDWLNGNLQLNPNSPAIDQLDLSSFPNLPFLDAAGNERLMNLLYDLGAYEWQGSPQSQVQVPEPFLIGPAALGLLLLRRRR